MSLTVNPLVYAALHLEVSIEVIHMACFCYTLDAEPPLERLLDSLLLPCVMQILQLWAFRSGPFTCARIS